MANQTIQKSSTGAYFTVSDISGIVRPYSTNDYDFIPAGDNIHFSVIHKYSTADNRIIISNQPYTNIINGDTSSAFADYASLQTYILANFFRNAGGSGGSYTLPVATNSTLGGVKQGSGVIIAGDGTLSSITSVAKKRLGSIYNVNLVSNSSSLYATSGAATTWSFTSTGLTTSGGANDTLNYQSYSSYVTNASYWSRSTTFKVTTFGNGIGIGLNSPTASAKIIGRITLNTGGNASLLLDIYRLTVVTNKVTSSSTLIFAINDIISLTLTRSMNDYILTASNLTSGINLSIEITDPMTYNIPAFVWSAANPAIWHYGGSQTITNDSYIVSNIVQNDVVLLGNSITSGQYSGGLFNTYQNILTLNTPGGFTTIAGGGNTTADDINLLPEILSLSPRVLIYDDGINDLALGISTSIVIANITTILNWCLSNNIQFVYCTIPPVASGYSGASTINANVVTVNNAIKLLPCVKVSDTYTALTSAGSLNSAYVVADNVHLNTTGQIAKGVQILSDIGYLVQISNNAFSLLNLFSSSNTWSMNNTFTTSITTPLILGGTGAGSALTLQSTSGTGTSAGAGINFNVGTNGSVTAMTVLNNGQIGIGGVPTALLEITSVGGTNKGLTINATSASQYADIDFVTTNGLIGQFLATGNSFASGPLAGNEIVIYHEFTSGKLTLGTASALPVRIVTGNTERFAITGVGNWALNTTAGTVNQVPMSNGTIMGWANISAKPHTIFTPTTGNTVTLINNQYNIINPTGALLALTITLPSSPTNNDCVFIKFTQNVTTVTYSGGTVVDGITAPTAGGLIVLTYDSGTTSWY